MPDRADFDVHGPALENEPSFLKRESQLQRTLLDDFMSSGLIFCVWNTFFEI